MAGRRAATVPIAKSTRRSVGVAGPNELNDGRDPAPNARGKPTKAANGDNGQRVARGRNPRTLSSPQEGQPRGWRGSGSWGSPPARAHTQISVSVARRIPTPPVASQKAKADRVRASTKQQTGKGILGAVRRPAKSNGSSSQTPIFQHFLSRSLPPSLTSSTTTTRHQQSFKK